MSTSRANSRLPRPAGRADACRRAAAWNTSSTGGFQGARRCSPPSSAPPRRCTCWAQEGWPPPTPGAMAAPPPGVFCWGTAGGVGSRAGFAPWADAARAAAAFPAPKPRPVPGEGVDAGVGAGAVTGPCAPSGEPVLPGCAPPVAPSRPVRGESARNVMVPSEGAGPRVPGTPPSAPVAAGPGVGRRNTNVPDSGTSPASGSIGGIVAEPSVRADRPSGWTGGSCAALGSAVLGSAAGAGKPQETWRSRSPPNPDWWERSAPHADAGSGRLPCWASAGFARRGSAAGDCGSSSKKCGPVSSTRAAAGAPSDCAGRLVPGTQAVPFQNRTYPGMDGSG